jgi:hypothetical protein
MNITPEDLIHGWDPFKEDPLLGFKKLRKDELFEKALYRAMRDRQIKSKEDIQSHLRKWPVDQDEKPTHSIYNTYRYFSQDLIDEFITLAVKQLEEEGYTQFANYALPDDVMAEMAGWCVKEMIDQGLLPNEPELVNLVMRSYK